MNNIRNQFTRVSMRCVVHAQTFTLLFLLTLSRSLYSMRFFLALSRCHRRMHYGSYVGIKNKTFSILLVGGYCLACFCAHHPFFKRRTNENTNRHVMIWIYATHYCTLKAHSLSLCLPSPYRTMIAQYIQMTIVQLDIVCLMRVAKVPLAVSPERERECCVCDNR